MTPPNMHPIAQKLFDEAPNLMVRWPDGDEKVSDELVQSIRNRVITREFNLDPREYVKNWRPDYLYTCQYRSLEEKEHKLILQFLLEQEK